LKLWHIALLVLIVMLVVGGPKVVDVVNKTKRVTSSPAVDGIVPTDPATLARTAGVDLETYALARMLASENGSSAENVKLAIGFATRNEAKARKKTISALLLQTSTRVDAKGKPFPAEGRFSAQNVAGGKYATTAVDPTAGDVEIAGKVIKGLVPDPTNGSTNFFSPKAQDKLVGTKPGYEKDAAAVDASWQAKGLRPVVVAGIPARDLTFYRKA
jgi:hypothetical protein